MTRFIPSPYHLPLPSCAFCLEARRATSFPLSSVLTLCPSLDTLDTLSHKRPSFLFSLVSGKGRGRLVYLAISPCNFSSCRFLHAVFKEQPREHQTFIRSDGSDATWASRHGSMVLRWPTTWKKIPDTVTLCSVYCMEYCMSGSVLGLVINR